MNVAVVTPYHKEPLWKLRRCHESVLAQTAACTHFLIADGHANPEVDAWDCRHVILPVEHGDNGNTPRAIGSLCAMNEGFDGILYLDADNWYAPDHAACVREAQQAAAADVVFARRHVVFPDGEMLDADDPEDTGRAHADTSCMAIFRPAFRALPGWCQMPRELGPRCDRVMFSVLTSEFSCAWTQRKSVFFETRYLLHFKLAGKEIPGDAKRISPIAPERIATINEEFAQRSYRPYRMRVPARF